MLVNSHPFADVVPSELRVSDADVVSANESLACVAIVPRPLMSDVLQASDTEIGVLLGAGFGIVYGLIGLPLAAEHTE